MTKKIVSWVLVVLGVFFALFPHSVHVSIGLTYAHLYHVIIGVILIAAGGWMLWGKKAA